jgi:NMD protein affecting ribosome stability and mRNA decay
MIVLRLHCCDCGRAVTRKEGSTTRAQKRIWRLCDECTLKRDWSDMRHWFAVTKPSYTERGASSLNLNLLPQEVLEP